MSNGKRDYKKEKRLYEDKHPERMKDRVARNKARREAIREGKVKKGDGKEVDHIKPLSEGGNNHKSNLRVVSRETNSKKEAQRKKDAARKK